MERMNQICENTDVNWLINKQVSIGSNTVSTGLLPSEEHRVMRMTVTYSCK